MSQDPITSLEQRLARYNERIAELERKADSAPPNQRDYFNKELTVVRKRCQEADEHLADLRRKQAESWELETLQTGLIRVFDDIGRRIDHLFGQTGQKS